MTFGRNDPCPCGSGRKFKKCCGGPESGAAGSSANKILGDIRELIQGQRFESMEDLNAFLGRHMSERNRSPVDDFEGLSPEQMHCYLHFPFDSPELVTFPEDLSLLPSAPVLTMFGLIADAAAKGGVKATATGNLPRSFCRDSALTFMGEDGYREHTRFGGINMEPDFPDLHTARIVSELAGLIRRYRGSFNVTGEYRTISTEHGPSGIYSRLLRAYAGKFNWAFRDRYPELMIIQQSFLFTLRLLARHGGEWRPNSFYEDAFLKAFPAAGSEPDQVAVPEDNIRSCYTWRSLVRFAAFYGLAEVEPASSELYERRYRIRSLPLLSAAVKFSENR